MSSGRLPHHQPSRQSAHHGSRDSTAPTNPSRSNISNGQESRQSSANMAHHQTAFNSNGSSPSNPDRTFGNERQWSEETSGNSRYGSKVRGDTFQCSDPTVINPPGEADTKSQRSDIKSQESHPRSKKTPIRIDPALHSPNLSYYNSSENSDDGFYGGRGASFVPDESTEPVKEHNSEGRMTSPPLSSSDRKSESPASQQQSLRSGKSQGEKIITSSPTDKSNIHRQQFSEGRGGYEDKGRASSSSRSNPNLSKPVGSWKESQGAHRSIHSTEHIVHRSTSNPSTSEIPHSSHSGSTLSKSFKLTAWEKSSMYTPFYQYTVDQIGERIAGSSSTEKIDGGNAMLSSNQPSPSTAFRGPSPVQQAYSLDYQALSSTTRGSSPFKSPTGSGSHECHHSTTIGNVHADAEPKTVPDEGGNHTEVGAANGVSSSSNEALKSGAVPSDKSNQKKVFGPRDEKSDPNKCRFDPKTRTLHPPIIDSRNKQTAEVGILDKESSSPPEVPFVGFYTSRTPSLCPMPIIVVHENMYRLIGPNQSSMPIPSNFEFTLFPLFETNGGLLRGPYSYCDNDRLTRFVEQIQSKRIIKTEFVTNGSDLSWRRSTEEEIRRHQLDRPLKDTPAGKRKVPDGKKDNIAGIQYPMIPTVAAKEAKGRYEFAMRPEKPESVKSFLNKEKYREDPIKPLDLDADIEGVLPDELPPTKESSAHTLKHKDGKNSNPTKSYEYTQKHPSGQESVEISSIRSSSSRDPDVVMRREASGDRSGEIARKGARFEESQFTQRSKNQQRKATALDSEEKETTVEETKGNDQSAANAPSPITSSTESSKPNEILALLQEAKAKFKRRSVSEDRNDKPTVKDAKYMDTQGHRSRCQQPKATASSSKPKVHFSIPKQRRRPSSIHARDENDPAQKLFNQKLAEFRAQNPKKPAKVYGMVKDTGPLAMPSFHEPSDDTPSDYLKAEPQFIAVNRIEFESVYGSQPVFSNLFHPSTYSEDKKKLKTYFTQDQSAQTGLSLLGMVYSPQQKPARSAFNIRKHLYKKYLGEEELKRNSNVYRYTGDGFKRNIQHFIHKFPFRQDDTAQMEKRVEQALQFLNRKEYIPTFLPNGLREWWTDAILDNNRVAIFDAMYFRARVDKLGDDPKYEREWKSFLAQIFFPDVPQK